MNIEHMIASAPVTTIMYLLPSATHYCKLFQLLKPHIGDTMADLSLQVIGRVVSDVCTYKYEESHKFIFLKHAIYLSKDS